MIEADELAPERQARRGSAAPPSRRRSQTSGARWLEDEVAALESGARPDRRRARQALVAETARRRPGRLRAGREGAQGHRRRRGPRRASARSATCGCGPRCSTTCARTTASSSATAASASSTSRPSPPRPAARSADSAVKADRRLHRRRVARQSGPGRLRRPDRGRRGPADRRAPRVRSASRPTTSPSTTVCSRRWRCLVRGRHRVARIRSDSELLVRQMRGEYRVKTPRPAAAPPRGARALAARLQTVTFEHIRRAENSEADRLANLAMDEGDTIARASDHRGHPSRPGGPRRRYEKNRARVMRRAQPHGMNPRRRHTRLAQLIAGCRPQVESPAAVRLPRRTIARPTMPRWPAARNASASSGPTW